jgi:hypothetical protein
MRVVLRCPNLARNGPTGPVWRCPFVGVDRKWSADGQNGANDSLQTFEMVVSAAECNNETAEGHRFALLPNISIRLDC